MREQDYQCIAKFFTPLICEYCKRSWVFIPHQAESLMGLLANSEG
jgi:hypothetical protein